MGAIGFVPLFGGPGYEHSLATGMLVPSAVAVVTAVDAARAGVTRRPVTSLGRGVALGLAFAAISLVTALLHAARVGICELWGALIYFAMNPAAGAIMGGAWGAVAGELVAAAASGRVVRTRVRTFAAVALALAGPLSAIAVSIYRFYTSPMIFAFDPFVGYFSGALYDTVIDQGTTILSYRAGTLATVTALALALSLLERKNDVRFGLLVDLHTPSARVRGILALVAAMASASLVFFGTKLGHFSTATSIAEDLGAEKHGKRCDVIYPKTTREIDARLLVKDCDEQIVAVEKRLGAQGPTRVRAFFFRDAADKKRLMGAAHTFIAKPWRGEVYLQLGGYPHPALGHELAHVVAASFGRGPFRIAGGFGGLLPNPGLIEGVAVFASPDDDDLTSAEWARAMSELGLLPPLDRTFSLGFLGDSSDKSYTVAGAFVQWLATAFGVDKVRAWYAGGDIAELTGKNWASLAEAFRASLEEVPLPAEAKSFAKARFSRPGIFGRKCPHVVDALRHDANVCRDSQRFDDAMRYYRQVLAKDAGDFASQRDLAMIERRHGNRAVGQAELLRLASDDNVPRVWQDRAKETLADADFIDGNFDRAAERYEEIAAHSLDEDAARTIEVKAFGARTSDARQATLALLLGSDKHGPDIFLGGIELGAWNAKKPSALASYLMGRNLVGRGLYEEGARVLGSVCERRNLPELPTARIEREALRQCANVACALADRALVERVRDQIESPTDPFRRASGGRRDATMRLMARCAP